MRHVRSAARGVGLACRWGAVRLYLSVLRLECWSGVDCPRSLCIASLIHAVRDTVTAGGGRRTTMVRNIASSLLLVLSIAPFTTLAAPPSNKKVEVDLRESINRALASDRFVQGLLSAREVHVLSRSAVTEDRVRYRVRIVRERNSNTPPGFNAVLGGPSEMTAAIARLPTGTSYVEVVDVLYRENRGEWSVDGSAVVERNSAAFDKAVEAARR